MAGIVEWSFANPEAALSQLSGEALGSASIDHRPVGLDLASNLSFGGDGAGKLALNIRGQLTVAVLNDPADPDEDGILTAVPSKTADGVVPGQLVPGGDRAYLKYRVEAGLKAAGQIPLGDLIGIEAGAEASGIFADYRAHGRHEQARSAFVLDLGRGARFVTSLTDVLALQKDEALAFRFAGALHASVTVSWSDLFTGQIGTLGRLLGTAAPVALSVTAGASVALTVRVSDDFLIVCSRTNPSQWRVGIRKVRSSRVAPSLDAGIDVGFANPKQLEDLAAAALEGLLGAPLKKVNDALAAASLESLGPSERRIAIGLLERFGLSQQFATIETLRARVAEAEKRVTDVVAQVVRTRVALGFAYEYSRVSTDTNLLQALVDETAVETFHADLIRARTEPLTRAIAEQRPGIDLELYLNQKEITRTHSWGFTLGFGKWASLGGRDFKKMSTVRRMDVQHRVQESYLGARSYTGQWIGEKSQWGVDLKADMKDYAAEPLVNDYSFGIHLLWVSEQKALSGSELEQWLDSAVLWRVLREQDLVETRAALAAAVGNDASLTVQLTIPNTVLRTLLPALAAAPADAYASGLAAGMPWMKISQARSSVSRRRQVYAPLWALYLHDPERPLASLAQAASDHVKKEGHGEMAAREVMTLHGPDPFSFAGLTHINGDTRAACDAFSRGARILDTAIASGARNQKTIDKAVGEMDDLWTQSHHVRAIGAYLLDAADRAGVLGHVTRTMTVEAAGLPAGLVITA